MYLFELTTFEEMISFIIKLVYFFHYIIGVINSKKMFNE